MAIHLEAVYEQGVLRPLEPLALEEHQRVHVTVEDRKRPLIRESAKPIDDAAAELEWLSRESRQFAGERVALDGNRLVAHGPKLAAVKATAQKAAKKVKPAVKKVVAKAKSSVKPVASKVSATAKTGKKKAGGLMQSVKHGVQAGIESVGDLVKKVAPAALLPKSAKPKRS